MTNEIQYRRDIDGLRGIAVLAVVLFHADLGLPGGYVGVDIFFVISGFLITGIIARQVNESRFRWMDFIVRRIRRIAPAAIVMTSCVLVVGVVTMTPAALDQLATSAFCQQFFASNVYFSKVSGYFAAPAERMPLLHTWTLSVEEQFYILLPMVLPWMIRRGWGITQCLLWTLTSLSFVASVWASTRSPENAFFLLPTRGWELAVGSLLALHVANPNSNAISPSKPVLANWLAETIATIALTVLLVVFFQFDSALPFPGYHAALPVLATVVLIGLGRTHATFIHRCLSARWLVGVGLISYSFYLWHWPIFSFAHILVGERGLIARVAMVIASGCIAIVSWRCVEQPARTSTKINPARALITYGSVTFCVAVVSLFIAKTNGLPSRLTPETLALTESLEIRHQSLATDRVEVKSGRLPRIGSTSTRPTFLVWGDSHALAASDVISRHANENDAAGWLAATGGNPPLLDVSQAKTTGGIHVDFADRNEAVFQFIEAKQVKHVWLIAAWQNYHQLDYTIERPPSVESTAPIDPIVFGLRRTIERLQAASVTVWVFRQPPVQPFDVGQTFLNQTMFGWPNRLPQTLDRSSFEQSRTRLDRLATEWMPNQSNAYPLIWVKPTESFFDESGNSIVVASGRPLYVDTHHLTSDGVEKFYGDAIDSILRMMRANASP